MLLASATRTFAFTVSDDVGMSAGIGLHVALSSCKRFDVLCKAFDGTCFSCSHTHILHLLCLTSRYERCKRFYVSLKVFDGTCFSL